MTDILLDATQTQMDTQSTQRRTGAISGYVLRTVLKEEYREPGIIDRSTDEYKMIGVLYTILGLIFLGGQSMTSSKTILV